MHGTTCLSLESQDQGHCAGAALHAENSSAYFLADLCEQNESKCAVIICYIIFRLLYDSLLNAVYTKKARVGSVIYFTNESKCQGVINRDIRRIRSYGAATYNRSTGVAAMSNNRRG